MALISFFQNPEEKSVRILRLSVCIYFTGIYKQPPPAGALAFKKVRALSFMFEINLKCVCGASSSSKKARERKTQRNNNARALSSPSKGRPQRAL
jgi:hypothetical protein